MDLTRRLDPVDPLRHRQRVGAYSYIWLDLDGLENCLLTIGRFGPAKSDSFPQEGLMWDFVR
jgi:hypothetical protein